MRANSPRRYRLASVLTAAFAALIVLAPATAARAEGTVTISGTVTSTEDGAPVAGVQVWVNNTTNPSFYLWPLPTTDAGGHYTLTGIPIGDNVAIWAGEQDASSANWFSAGTNVASYTVDSTVDIQLHPAPKGPGALTLTVKDRDGDLPLANANVSIRDPRMGMYRYNRNNLYTDADGEIAITDIPTGDFVLSATVAGHYTSSLWVHVADGTPQTHEIELTATPPTTGSAKIALTVTSGGAPVEHYGVCAVPKLGSNTGCMFSFTDASGLVEFPGLAAGGYTLQLDAGGTYLYPSQASTIVVIAADGDVVTRSIDLVPYRTGVGSVSGVVHDTRTGQPVSGATISLSPSPYDRSYPSLQTWSASDGGYSISGVPDGDYYVGVNYYPAMGEPNPFEYELDPAVITVSGGAAVALSGEDDLTSIPAGTGTIDGVVRDPVTHLAIGGLTVSLNRTNGGYQGTAEADSAGRFRFTGLPAGEYGVWVADSRGAYVSLQAGATESIVAAYTGTTGVSGGAGDGTISGVVTMDGEPVEGLRVSVPFGTSATTDVNGRYVVQLDDVPYGDIPVYLGNSSPGMIGQIPAPSIVPMTAGVSFSASAPNPGHDFVAFAAASISGGVTAVGGAPFDAYSQVTLVDVATGEELPYFGIPAQAGEWSMDAIPAGTYKLLLRAGAGPLAGNYGDQPTDASVVSGPAPRYWKDGVPGGVADLAAATTFTVAAGTTTDGFDFAEMPAGSTITGTVAVAVPGGASVPLPGVRSITVLPYQQVGSSWVALDWATSYAYGSLGGRFDIAGLHSGNYKFRFSDDESAGSRKLSTVWAGGSADDSGAQIFTVVAGSPITLPAAVMSVAAPTADGGVIDLATMDQATVDGLEGGISAPGSATAGDEVTLEVGTDLAGEWVEVWANSTPLQIASWRQVGADGTVTVTLPDSLIGTHHLIAQDADSYPIGWTEVNLAPAGTSGAGASSGGVGASSGSSTAHSRGAGGSPRGTAVVSEGPSAGDATENAPSEQVVTSTPTPTPRATTAAPSTPGAGSTPAAAVGDTAASFDPAVLLWIIGGGIAVLVVGGGVIWFVRSRLAG